MKRHIYLVELTEEPGSDVTWPGNRMAFLSRSAANRRVGVLADHGVRAEVRRSNPVTWPEAAI